MNGLQVSTAYRPFTTLSPLQQNISLEASSNATAAKDDACDFSMFEFVAYFAVQPIICLVGALLNLLSFCIFYRGKQFQGNPTYRLMMVLALFDALTLLLTLPSSFIRCKNYLSICDSKLFKKFRMGAYVLQLFAMYPLINICEGVSVSITVLLSIERYISIKYHYIIKAYFSPSNVRNLVLVLISACFVINLPLVFVQTPKAVYKNVTVPNHSELLLANDTEAVSQQRGELRMVKGVLTAFGKSKAYPIYTWTRIFIYNFLPLIFLAVINAFLIYIVRTSGHFRKQSSQTRSAEKRLKGQRNLTILLVIVIFLFLAGQIPLAFANVAIFKMITGCSVMEAECCIFYNRYRAVTNSICLITYGANFFVYLALNKHFRAEVIRLCHCLKVRRQNGTAAAHTVIVGEDVEMIRKDRDKEAVTMITDGNGEIEAYNANNSSEES